MELSLNSTFELNNGEEIPIIGLGTYGISGKFASQAVKWALELGYRLIDTATIYGNERVIGKAIKNSNIKREELFITTKVWNTDQGYDKTFEAFETSLKKLNMSYVDLYLIHWPVTGLRGETWRALEKIYEEKRAKVIGVSNFTINHLKELMENSETIPGINQVDFSPFLYQKNLLKFCEQHKIIVEAYSPLTRGRKLDHTKLKTISEKYGKTPAQILLRWGIQQGIIQIPKSGNKQHLQENIDIFNFKLTEKDMEMLNSLNENFRVADNPNIWK